MSNFVHCHVHSDQSPDSTNEVQRLAKYAKSVGMSHLALTDHGTVSNLIPFSIACKEAGIIPIYGNECYIRYADSVGHITVLSYNATGYENLIKLSNEAFGNLHGQRAGGGKAPCVEIEMLNKYNEGLIVLTGCPASPVYQNEIDFGMLFVEKLMKRYSGRLYAEVTFTMPHDLNWQNKNYQRITQIASEFGLPLVVTGDAHYTEKTHEKAHNIVTENRTKFSYPASELYLKTASEMKETVEKYGDSDLWEQSEVSLKEITSMIEPVVVTNEPELPYISPEEIDELLNFLHSQCPVDKVHQERFSYELETLRKKNFLNYFYFIYRIGKFCRENKYTITSRGSAAGSLILYLLGMSYVDPIETGLQFERFLNPAREEYPDVDLDMSSSTREKVFEFLSETWGFRKVSNFITYGHKTTVNILASALNLPFELSKAAADMETTDSVAFLKLCEDYPEFEQLYEIIVGQYKTRGTHAAAVAALPKHIIVPIEIDGSIALDKKALEKFGGIKIDCLVVDALDKLDIMIADSKLELPKSFNDYPPEVFDMLCDGKATGLFQLSSDKGLDILKQVKPRNLEELAHVNALNRPAVIQNGYDEVYIGNKFGGKLSEQARHDKIQLDRIFSLYPEIEKILAPTYGIVLLQEQMMEVYSTVTGGGLADADIARRVLSPKSPKQKLDPKWQEQYKKVKAHFLESEGFDSETKEFLWIMLEQSTGYSFNKAHSLSYAACIALQQAYIKCFDPLTYYLSMLRGGSGSLENAIPAIYSMISENPELTVSLPHVNTGTLDYEIDGDTIILPLTMIKGVGEKSAEKIISIREVGGLFTSVEDVVKRIPGNVFNKNMMPHIIESDCVRGLAGYEAKTKRSERLELERLIVGFPIPCKKLVEVIEQNVSSNYVVGYIKSTEVKKSKNTGKSMRRYRLAPNGFVWHYPNEFPAIDVGRVVSFKTSEWSKVVSFQIVA